MVDDIYGDNEDCSWGGGGGGDTLLMGNEIGQTGRVIDFGHYTEKQAIRL